VVWRVRLSDRIYASPFCIEERVYICTVDGNLYCLDAEWGKEIWKLPLGAQVTSSPVITPEGRLYIGSREGTLFCVDAQKHKVLWRFATGGPIPGSPRVADNVVYFGSMDHRVYALPTEAVTTPTYLY
jgi:eukaryotic-like serine/threonine-protein kinase